MEPHASHNQGHPCGQFPSSWMCWMPPCGQLGDSMISGRHILKSSQEKYLICIYTRWCPPVISWFIIPLTIDISTIIYIHNTPILASCVLTFFGVFLRFRAIRLLTLAHLTARLTLVPSRCLDREFSSWNPSISHVQSNSHEKTL